MNIASTGPSPVVSEYLSSPSILRHNLALGGLCSVPHKTSSDTSVTLDLGTGAQAVERPPNLSHLSDEHLEGLRIAVNEEYDSRQQERKHLSYTHPVEDRRGDYDGCLGMTDATISMKKYTYFPEDSDRDDFAR